VDRAPELFVPRSARRHPRTARWPLARSRTPSSSKAKVGGARHGAGRPALAPSEKRSKSIRIRATPTDMAGAKALAELEQTSLSDLGLAALRLAIARGSTRTSG